ncbi:hypothetical protein BGZ63DRAFT_146450 [Mariannaea sp. PMI_226]|nr:hypothetical protein BGZ63DRAFT_146450 [Mariannaea sp. PMI_226]
MLKGLVAAQRECTDHMACSAKVEDDVWWCVQGGRGERNVQSEDCLLNNESNASLNQSGPSVPLGVVRNEPILKEQRVAYNAGSVLHPSPHQRRLEIKLVNGSLEPPAQSSQDMLVLVICITGHSTPYHVQFSISRAHAPFFLFRGEANFTFKCWARIASVFSVLKTSNGKTTAPTS